jgi:hypothetical protein
MPTWSPANLALHHQKRITKDKGCLEDLLGITGRAMTEQEYEQRSQKAFTSAWGEYEGEGRNVSAQTYYPKAAYFVDDELVVAITDSARKTFHTCYHDHLGTGRHGPMPSLGQRKLRYIQELRWRELGKMIRNLRRIRNV